MRYDYPDYYEDFHCVGGKECPDSCCIVWQIEVDRKTRKKYRTVDGTLGRRMREKIDTKTGKITPHGDERRCEFLNDDNLCDIILELGEDYLCQTCATHPRHEEVYENHRERSLSITCPIMCRDLLERTEPVKIVSKYTKETEHDFYFDRILFKKLLMVRDVSIEISQNRELPVFKRMFLLLGMAHDIERRVILRANRKKTGFLARIVSGFPEFTPKESDDIEVILCAYKKKDAFENTKHHIEEAGKHEKILLHTDSATIIDIFNDMIFPLMTMEVLNKKWFLFLQSIMNMRAEMQYDDYEKCQTQFMDVIKPEVYEQLLVYFVYVYTCTSVYDDRILAKIKMAVVNTLLIRELFFMKWFENDKKLTLDEQAEIAHSFVREIENSDENMEQWDSLMQRNPRYSLNNLFCVLSLLLSKI